MWNIAYVCDVNFKQLNFAVCYPSLLIFHMPMRKKLATVTAHRELTVSSPWAHRGLTVTNMVTASRDWAVTWAVIELWPSRDWAVIILKMPWLNCDLAVTELWPRRDWAVTSPSRDSAVIIGPRSRDHRGHRELTVSSRWPFIFSWVWDLFRKISCQFNTLEAKCVSRVN